MVDKPNARHSSRWYSWRGRFEEAAKSSGRVSGIPCSREDEEGLAHTAERFGEQNGATATVERLANWPGYVQVVFASSATPSASEHRPEAF